MTIYGHEIYFSNFLLYYQHKRPNFTRRSIFYYGKYLFIYACINKLGKKSCTGVDLYQNYELKANIIGENETFILYFT